MKSNKKSSIELWKSNEAERKVYVVNLNILSIMLKFVSNSSLNILFICFAFEKELERRRQQQQQQQHIRLSSHHRASKSNKCQITMTYQGNGSKKYGDEIMVLQENLIVFKGFLRTQG